jgi:uncharacterized protein
MMQILRVADQRAMPWKNGGGVTYEVAIFPPDAPLDGFDWRVSMARVESDGPFSNFPGIDRSLAIMHGHGLHVVVDGTDRLLGPQSRPLAFSGDVSASATLTGGPIIDLNVMTRRDAWRHQLSPETLNGSRTVAADSGATFVIVRSGKIRVGDEQLRPRDALRLAAGEQVKLAAEVPAELFRIDLVQF